MGHSSSFKVISRPFADWILRLIRWTASIRTTGDHYLSIQWCRFRRRVRRCLPCIMVLILASAICRMVFVSFWWASGRGFTGTTRSRMRTMRISSNSISKSISFSIKKTNITQSKMIGIALSPSAKIRTDLWRFLTLTLLSKDFDPAISSLMVKEIRN